MKKQTKQEQLQEVLELRIRNGELSAGALLPSERELGAEYSMSRVTVRLALNSMVKNHKLRPVRGKGYFVLDVPEEPMKNTLNIGGVWLSDIHAEWSMALFSPTSEVLEGLGFHLFLSCCEDDETIQAYKICSMLEKNVDGLLIVPTYHGDALGNRELLKTIRASGKPVMLFDRPFEDVDLPCVVNDDIAGGEMAAEYFVRHGHKRIALITFDKFNHLAKLRLGAFEKRCAENGVDIFCYEVPYDSHISLNQMLKHLEKLPDFVRGNDITGVFTLLTFPDALVDYMEYCGLAHELDFLLYDGPLRFYSSRVAVVSRPLTRIAYSAAERLAEMITKKSVPYPFQIKLKPEIINTSFDKI